MKEILTMRHIDKNFPGVRALSNVDFTLREGEIHALMGENGAGKSTLIKVLTGVEEFESGDIRVDGIEGPVINRSPEEAQKNGISTVYQEVNLCPNLTVAENLYIGRQPRTAFGTIDWKTINENAKKVLTDLDIDVDVTKNVEDCSVAIQQMIAIARAVDISAKILILDEPTSSLDDNEVEKLFTLMRKLQSKGMGIIFVTHFLEQVYEVCDKITVLRNGELVGEFTVEELPRVQLVAKMMGKDFDDLAEIKSAATETDNSHKEVLISAKQLGSRGAVHPFDVDIYKGDVIGLSGLLGSGRSELARTIYGIQNPDEGELFVKGKKVHIKQPIQAMKLGMGLLPEDRKDEGIIADLSVRENIIIALQAKRGVFRLISRKQQEEFADKYIDILQIKTAHRDTPIKQLSGGNQQKAILGRWLLTDPDFLVLDEPTRGIDVGTKTEIQKLVVKLADEGKTVVFISSEIEEMIRTCRRMIIMRDTYKVGELPEMEISKDNIMKAIAGGAEHE
ncbi:MAG: sugar ABC transporter ATP-binding protein [Lachnospiraceae bacterium]|nr:sugar ABC transporter ATP-binding protein [Lachnospiraceae bacterium]